MQKNKTKLKIIKKSFRCVQEAWRVHKAKKLCSQNVVIDQDMHSYTLCSNKPIDWCPLLSEVSRLILPVVAHARPRRCTCLDVPCWSNDQGHHSLLVYYAEQASLRLLLDPGHPQCTVSSSLPLSLASYSVTSAENKKKFRMELPMEGDYFQKNNVKLLDLSVVALLSKLISETLEMEPGAFNREAVEQNWW